MKYQISSFLLLSLLLCAGFLFAQDAVKGFSKGNFYSAMGGDDQEAINAQLAIIKTIDLKDKAGYEGALLMKKAGLVGGPKKKLDLFKAGHNQLEDVLNKDSSNTEFRFLRLMIQENAPGILGYKKNLENDKLFIKNHYKKSPPVVQEAIAHYSKGSKILKPADLL